MYFSYLYIAALIYSTSIYADYNISTLARSMAKREKANREKQSVDLPPTAHETYRPAKASAPDGRAAGWRVVESPAKASALGGRAAGGRVVEPPAEAPKGGEERRRRPTTMQCGARQHLSSKDVLL